MIRKRLFYILFKLTSTIQHIIEQILRLANLFVFNSVIVYLISNQHIDSVDIVK